MLTKAYNRHHALVLRPDDVWQAIVVQFSLYVQARAEKLRSTFVAHDGKKELTVRGGGTLFTAAYDELAKKFTAAIGKNLKDPSIADWITPDFSTTTDTDRVAASISLMATVQAYFDFKMCLMCGLPSVQLEGTVEDWEVLVAKANRLTEFDTEEKLMAKWHGMLMPVLGEMLETKQGIDNMDWWQRVCTYSGGGSGPTYLSGWATVFAVFNGTGKWQASRKDDFAWPIIDLDDVPGGIVSCPVTIDDNGHEYKAQIFAGQFACETKTGSDLHPRNDWCLALTSDQIAT